MCDLDMTSISRRRIARLVATLKRCSNEKVDATQLIESIVAAEGLHVVKELHIGA